MPNENAHEYPNSAKEVMTQGSQEDIAIQKMLETPLRLTTKVQPKD